MIIWKAFRLRNGISNSDGQKRLMKQTKGILCTMCRMSFLMGAKNEINMQKRWRLVHNTDKIKVEDFSCFFHVFVGYYIRWSLGRCWYETAACRG